MKLLIACALIAAMSQTAMAQIPEPCKGLQNITDFKWKRDNVGQLSLYALIKNNGPYDVTFAAFSFDFYADEHLKIGEGTTSIGRLTREDKEEVLIHIITPRINIDDIHGITLARISCTVSR